MKTMTMLATLLCGSVTVACVQTGGSPITAEEVGTPDGSAGLQHHPPARDAGAEDAAVAQVDAGAVTQCVALHDVCEPGTAGCCDGYCLFGYVSGTCIPKAADGEGCEEDSACASGRCGESICRTAECSAPEGACFSDTECCSGFCTWGAQVYAPGQCAPRQPSGGACADHNQCVTWNCQEGTCL